jgi:general secretion pathway protein J
MEQKNGITGHSGFTLMEILVAIVIFSILFTVLFGSFRFLATSSDDLGRGALQFEMGQQCLSRITGDLESAYVSIPPVYRQPEKREGEEDPYRITGTIEDVGGNPFSQIRFTSLAHFSFSGSQTAGVAEIVYYVSRYHDDGNVLRRSDTLYPYEEFEEKSSDPIVCKNVQGFSITYYDEEGEESEEWDSESSETDYSTPRSIQLLLRVGDESSPLVFTTRVHLPSHRPKLESS